VNLDPWLDDHPIAGPDEAHFFTGADPCWSRAREVDVAHEGAAPPATCPTCGADGVSIPIADEVVHLPGRIEEGSRDVCATCMRYGRDAQVSVSIRREKARQVRMKSSRPDSRPPDRPPARFRGLPDGGVIRID
jgi:hypothetical protein